MVAYLRCAKRSTTCSCYLRYCWSYWHWQGCIYRKVRLWSTSTSCHFYFIGACGCYTIDSTICRYTSTCYCSIRSCGNGKGSTGRVGSTVAYLRYTYWSTGGSSYSQCRLGYIDKSYCNSYLVCLTGCIKLTYRISICSCKHFTIIGNQDSILIDSYLSYISIYFCLQIRDACSLTKSISLSCSWGIQYIYFIAEGQSISPTSKPFCLNGIGTWVALLYWGNH